jgi:ribosomal protein S18 acetylase RimI-like enzyme
MTDPTPWFLTVRPAEPGDRTVVLAAVSALLHELSGSRSSLPVGAPEAFARLIEQPATGGVLVATAARGGPGPVAAGDASGLGAEQVVGVLGYASALALRTGGEHLVLEELWVDSRTRGRGVGRALVAALGAEARARELSRIEVGLPGPAYPGLASAWDFYRDLGFRLVGERARLDLPTTGGGQE